MSKKNILILSVVIILIAGAAFYGGMKYAGTTAPQNNFQRNGNRAAQFGQMGQRNGNRPTGGEFANGEVIKKDEKSITVKLRDGGSKIIYLPESVSILKSTEGSISDVEIGKNIMANGSANSDGSITAQSVQIRPESANNKIQQ